jgi:tripartite motif-containing protein 71
MKIPCLMALDDEGNIIVADEGSHRLHIIQCTDGVLLRTIGSFGTQPGQFIGPRAVAFCGDGNIVVADTLNNRVQVLRYVDGSHVLSIGEGTGLFNGPCAVAVDGIGNVFVRDAGNGRVHVFRLSDGVLLRSMCSLGSGDGQFKGSGGIAIDKDVLYVVDNQNHRVQALRRSDGKHLRSYGTEDVFKLYPPFDVALYGADHIIVATNGKCIIFRKDGVKIRDLHYSNMRACGVVIDDEGRIIVSDHRNRRTNILE